MTDKTLEELKLDVDKAEQAWAESVQNTVQLCRSMQACQKFYHNYEAQLALKEAERKEREEDTEPRAAFEFRDVFGTRSSFEFSLDGDGDILIEEDRDTLIYLDVKSCEIFAEKLSKYVKEVKEWKATQK